MNNLRLYGGRVPVATGHPDNPIVLVDFPAHDVFAALYSKRVKGENIDRYWEILRAIAQGATLTEAAKSQGITRERVRQIEAKFLRLMRQNYHQQKRHA
jgi:acetyl-CoA acetyltransferase